MCVGQFVLPTDESTTKQHTSLITSSSTSRCTSNGWLTVAPSSEWTTKDTQPAGNAVSSICWICVTVTSAPATPRNLIHHQYSMAHYTSKSSLTIATNRLNAGYKASTQTASPCILVTGPQITTFHSWMTSHVMPRLPCKNTNTNHGLSKLLTERQRAVKHKPSRWRW